MNKIAIIYWPYKGATERAAIKIQDTIGKEKADLFKLSDIDYTIFSKYEKFIVGGSTAGADIWENSKKEQWGLFAKSLIDNNISLKGKRIAIFGMGNQILYPENFVDDIKILYDYFKSLSAELVGKWPSNGYNFTNSKAIEGNNFLGLALDEDTQDELSKNRIFDWIKLLEF